MATYYWDPVGGSDSNSGTVGSPWSVFGGSGANSLETRFEAGHTCLIARGTVITPTASNAYMLACTPTSFVEQYIGTYTAGYGDDPPIFDALLYDVTTGWSHDTAGRWVKDFAANPPSDSLIAFTTRAWAGMSAPGANGSRTDVFKHQSSAAACVAEKQFFTSGLVVTVYTGGSTAAFNPVTFYNGLAFGRRITTATSGGLTLAFVGMNGQALKDFHVRGGGFRFTGSAGATLLRNATLSDLGVYYGSLHAGFLMHAVSEGITENVRIVRPLLDMMTSSNEDRGTSLPFGTSDGIQYAYQGANAGGSIRNVEIIDPNMRGARHCLINCQSLASAGIDMVSGIVVRSTKLGRAVLDSQDVDYGRGFNLGVSGYTVNGIIVNGDPTSSQFRGSGIIKGSQWINGREATTTNSNQGTANYVQIFGAYESATGRVQHTVNSHEVTGNVFSNPWNYCIRTSDTLALGGGFEAGSIRVHHNTFIDLLHYNGKTSRDAGTYAYPGACIIATAATYQDYPRFPISYNNVFIIPVGETTCYLHANNDTGVDYGSGTAGEHVLVSLTANDATAPVVPYGNQVFNTATAAGLDSSYRPTSASDLYRAGTHVSYGIDASGKQRWNPPTVGAYEA
jgi:hypothetical protein